MRPKILAGNWKMNFLKDEAHAFVENLAPLLKPHTNAQMRIYAPSLFLDSLNTAVKKSTLPPLPFILGAQNCSAEKSGAFTGEISAAQLQSIGIHQTLVGHSERRQFFGDSDEVVLKKCQSLTAQGFEVLLCVGETLHEREANKTGEVLARQLENLFLDPTLKSLFGKKIHIAYEPVWAIGTGKTASPAQAEEVHAWIRALLAKHISPETGSNTAILYGGSVTPANFAELLQCSNVDGGLVGGASLKLD